MDTKFIDLKFESNNKILEVGKGKSYRLLNIDGLDSGELELVKSHNILSDGSTINNKKIKDRTIIVEIEYTGPDKENKRREMTSFFNIHHEGTLTIDYQGVKKSIKYDTESYKAKLENLHNPFSFLVFLYCPNPFLRDVTETKEEIAIWRGSFEFPLELVEEGIELGYREPSLIVNVLNKGDVECGMKIQFKALATLVNPSLFNVNTREYFKINRTMEAGEVITVTTHFQNKRVLQYKNGMTSNVFNWIDLDSTFLQLDVGDNLFRYDADEGLDNLEVTIYYTPQYLGV